MQDRPPDTVALEDKPCPNGCPPADRFVLEGSDRLHGVPGRFRVVACEACGLMRTNPRPTAATIGTYYPSDYAPYASTRVAVAAPLPAWRMAVRRLLGIDSRRLPPMAPGHLLEIGCASGSFLDVLRAQGWSVEGIEFSDSAAARARASGLRVQTASIESAAPPQSEVDLVAAWMVLEHLHEPVHALRRLRGWTRTGGYLVASVPDAGAWARRLFGERSYDLQVPTHLYHYTPRTLGAVLERAGWELTRVRWQRNCNNLLWSLEYWSSERGRPRLLSAVRWLRTAPAAHRARVALGWLLGITRQSGRIEVWARAAEGGRNGAR